jgi:hypothetical protein
MEDFSAHQVCVLSFWSKPQYKRYTIFFDSRYLDFRFLPHLRRKNSVPTPFWSLHLEFKFATLEFPVPAFGETVSSSVAVCRYLCSYKTDDASLSRPEYLARQLLFIHHTRPTKLTSHLNYFKSSIPCTYAHNSFCIYTFLCSVCLL